VELPVLAGRFGPACPRLPRERDAAQALVQRAAVCDRHRGSLPEAGVPQGVFQTLLVGSGVVDQIIADDRVRA